MAFGALSLVARFVLGLGGSTHLSDTYAWGLWIVFDLVWIAVAAGAFATAGLIYVFRRKDLYSMGRAAVLMGLLSYSFVTVTLVADLGLPWNFWQLGLQAPEQSAMFEVSWCVGLYVTILLFEFLPVAVGALGPGTGHGCLASLVGRVRRPRRGRFVYLLSRSLALTAAAAVVFAALAWVFRPRGKEYEPVMLAIAAVTLSTMHQSSLGSLFLLMPDKLGAQWWSPVLPVSFFLSSIASGTALVILVEMWIAKAWHRTLRMSQLASLGNITFWSLLVYLVWRLGDMALRGQFAGAFGGRLGALFLVEIVLGGLVPLAMLARLFSTSPADRPDGRGPADDAGRGAQPGECRGAGHVPERREAAVRAGALPAVDLRVGRVDRSHRRGDLPLRPRRAAVAGAPQGTGYGRGLRPLESRGLVARHPYLQPMAEVYALVEGAMAEVDIPARPSRPGMTTSTTIRAGVPLLQSPAVAIDLTRRRGDRSLVEDGAAALPDRLAAESQALAAELGRDPDIHAVS